MSEHLDSLLHDIHEKLNAYTNGNLEPRLTHLKKYKENHYIASELNNFLDKVETLIRETNAAISHNNAGIDLRGFKGSFLDTAKYISQVTQKNKDLHASLEKREREQRILLDNLEQGFMTCDEKGVIHNGASKKTIDLFGVNPEGKNISEVLQLNEKAANSVKDWLRMMFMELLPLKDLIPLGPTSFHKNNNRFITLNYQLIHKDNKIEKIIIISNDITKEKELEKKAQYEANHAKMILSILQDKRAYHDFADETLKAFNILCAFKQIKDKDDLQIIFRLIHTIKGGAATYSMDELKNKAHQLENTLSHYLNEELQFKDDELEKIIIEINRLRKIFDTLHEESTELIGQKKVKLEKNLNMEKVLAMASQIEKYSGQNSNLYQNFMESFVLEPITNGFKKFEEAIQRISQRLEKEVVYKIEASTYQVNLNHYGSFISSTIHAFRNAVDHGFDYPEEREKVGKPKHGTITIYTSHSPIGEHFFRLHISDDGKGISAEKIAQLAVSKNISSEEDIKSMKDEEIIQYVLEPNFSTKKTITEVSGRGIGLDAIKYEAEKLGGFVKVATKLGLGSDIICDLPLLTSFSDS